MYVVPACTVAQLLYSSQLLQLLGVRAFWRSGCTSSFLRCIFRLVFDISFYFLLFSSYYRVPIPNTEAEPGIVSELGQLSHSSQPLSEHVSFTFQSIQI
jgi:hypothetical protein